MVKPRRARSGLQGAPSGVTLTDHVYQKLRAAILTCELLPGSNVSELDLANQFDVSKTPVREALGKLASEGYVTAFARRGYQITHLTISDMNEILDCRAAVEAGAAELACLRMSDDELDQLRKMSVATPPEHLDTYRGLVAINRAFHEALASASRNKRMVQLVLRYVDDLERFIFRAAQLKETSRPGMVDHVEIVDVLGTRNVAAARAIMRAHAEETRARLVLLLTSDQSTLPVLV